MDAWNEFQYQPKRRIVDADSGRRIQFGAGAAALRTTIARGRAGDLVIFVA